MKKIILVTIIMALLISMTGCAQWGRELFGVPEVTIVTEKVEEKPEPNLEAEELSHVVAKDSNTYYHLAIIVGFLDIPLSTEEEEWAAFFYGDDISLRTYYLDQTKGKLNVTPAMETGGTIDNGVIVVNLDMVHPNLNSEYMLTSNEEVEVDREQEFFEEVLFAADEYIDFSQYDFNTDSIIDEDELIITVIAGGYQDDINYIYDEKASAGVSIGLGNYLFFDQVGIGDFLMSGEIQFNSKGEEDFPTIGIACHEFGHALGLPDLYDVDYSSVGLGFHALMADGTENGRWDTEVATMPAPLMAWSKIYIGAALPIVVEESGEYQLYARSQDDYNVLKIFEEDGYYLLENVDFEGFGGGLKDFMEEPGIAVWYIDSEKTTRENMQRNTVNNDEEQRGVSLIEANGTRDLYEEFFDYYRTDYNHYFSSSNGGTFVTEGGATITFLSEPGEIMTVNITF